MLCYALRCHPQAHRRSEGTSAEQRAGVFYVSPARRYRFAHPQATGHAESPFHAVWFCGGWPTDPPRRVAMAALHSLRASGQVELFRSAAMLQTRGHFTPASAAKKV